MVGGVAAAPKSGPDRSRRSGVRRYAGGQQERRYMSDLTGQTTGERIKYLRNRAGMPRPILSGLVGRSAE